jgi:hypothetical protein
MKEQVLVKRISITKSGEIQYFQIRVPRDAERIIGIEVGLSRTQKGFSEYIGRGDQQRGPITQDPAPVKGEAIQTKSLISPAPIPKPVPIPVPLPRSNGFPLRFTRGSLIGELKLQSQEKANVFFSSDVFERDQNVGYAYYAASRVFNPNVYTHEFKRYEERVIVNGITTLLEGCFIDRIGARFKTNLSYQVNVYVWYETKDLITEDHDNRLCS